VRAVRGLSAEIPIVAGMTFLADGRTAFGEDAAHALSTLALAGADAVGMNCTLGPKETHDIFSKLPESLSVPLSVMPNAGYPSVVHGRNVYLSSPDYLREYAAAFVAAGAAIVGGCCGTTPEHIRAMALEVAGKKRTRSSRPESIVIETQIEHFAEAPIETSRLKRKLANPEELVITAEVEPPRGTDVSSAVEGARLFKACGVDGVNVTDNPMARLRMSSIAVAALIQRETGLDAVVQITTRDRNVLGLQSDLLGAAGLGVKAILCLGGDPLKIGDYPQAKQVSEVDVLGLLRIAKGLNAGADLAGNAIGAPTRFAIACAANPAAADQEVEFSKLRAKIEAGASFAQTQPVYDLEALERFLARPEARAIPVLVGLIPLLSLKQTLFFANEVPGVVVPAAIQERMRRAAERGAEHERAEGLAIARDLAAGIARLARGIHIMPMGKYKIAGEILEAIPRRAPETQRAPA
jgi:homocysteine S-methyltransferase